MIICRHDIRKFELFLINLKNSIGKKNILRYTLFVEWCKIFQTYSNIYY